jgi:hypothetical protein
MANHKEFIEEIKTESEEGNHIPLSHPKLNDKISITKGMYILFGGMPGSGKTAIVDSVFVLEMFDWWLANKETTSVKPKWIYRSMERKEKHKRAKWLAYKLYKDHKILIDVPTIMGWPNKLYDVSPALWTLMESYDSYFDELFSHMEFVSGPTNPTGVYKFAKEYMLGRGHVEQVSEHNKKYIPNDSNEIVFHITDHIGKVKGETGHFGDKQILDKHSSYMADELRDFYDMVPIDVSQLNRSIEDTYRGQKTELDIQPKDFKGTADTYENADLVIGLINPYKLGVEKYANYDIPKFITEAGYNRFRGLKVIKNSYGNDDFVIGYNFIGENGMMRELPRSDRMYLAENLRDRFDNYVWATNLEDNSRNYM